MNEEQLTKAVEQLSVEVTANRKAIAGVIDSCKEVLTACKALLVESKQAQEMALHAFKIDECGWVWRWDLNAKTYVKTDCRINKPVKRGEDDITDGAVTTPKLADFAVTEQKLDPDIVNQIHSAGRHGYVLSNKFGESTLIGITQKTLTDAVNGIWDKIDELAGEVTHGLKLIVTPDYIASGTTIHIEATTVESNGILENVAIFLNDSAQPIATGENVHSLERDVLISDTTKIKCIATILGVEYMKEVTVENLFWLGAGNTYQDVMTDGNLRPVEKGLTGSYDVDVTETGQHIIIILAESLASDFVRADMNGFEIPMTMSTQTVDGVDYAVFVSDNVYAAGTYNIDINR